MFNLPITNSKLISSWHFTHSLPKLIYERSKICEKFYKIINYWSRSKLEDTVISIHSKFRCSYKDTKVLFWSPNFLNQEIKNFFKHFSEFDFQTSRSFFISLFKKGWFGKNDHCWKALILSFSNSAYFVYWKRIFCLLKKSQKLENSLKSFIIHDVILA